MEVIQDYIGATLVGGMLLLSILGFQATTTEAATAHNLASLAQRDLSFTAEVLDHDFRKMGYRVVDTLKVVSIDSSSIVFRGDFDDNGTIDSLRYFVVSGDAGAGNRMTLYRKLNNQAASVLSSEVNRFRLGAYDASGAPTMTPSRIRCIKIALGVKGKQAIDNQYPSAYWERVIKPHNLR